MISRLVCAVVGHKLKLPVGERDRRDGGNHLLGWEATCPRCRRTVFEPIEGRRRWRDELESILRGGIGPWMRGRS